MTITGYYVCGTNSTIADQASEVEPSALVHIREFDTYAEKAAFEAGLEFADGWEEVNQFDTQQEALDHIAEAMGEESDDDDEGDDEGSTD